MLAIIMAGGKGSRLLKKMGEQGIPKPMISIAGKPVLEHQVLNLKRNGFSNIVMVIGFLGNVIKEYFGNGSKWGIDISYVEEEKPLGTCGALYYLRKNLTEDFFLIFGDLVFDIDCERMHRFHLESGARLTLFAHPNSHPFDSDLIICDSNYKVTKLDYKNNERDYFYKNLVNAGIYVLSPRILEHFASCEKPQYMDLEKDLISTEISEGMVYAYCSSEYVKDMGTYERYSSVVNDLDKGIIQSRNYKRKQRCIFIDRDGTINKHKGFLSKAEDFELLDSVCEAIKMINDSLFLCIVLTNQPVIARGECTVVELENIHNKMETLLGERGAYIDDVFYCPHHPHGGYEGEVKELKFDCDCRKPKIGMFLKAAEKHNIDLAASWFVGDTETDVLAGKNAGTDTILLENKSLLEAITWILSKEYQSIIVS